MNEHGPFTSEREALATQAAARVDAAFDADPGPETAKKEDGDA